MAARRYRLRLYDDGADVTGDRDWLVALDLDDGLGVTLARAELDRLLLTLARHDGAKDSHLHRYYLAVHHWETNERVCHWPPRHDREDDKAWA